MPVEVVEKFESRLITTSANPSVELRYAIRGTNDDVEARNALVVASPGLYDPWGSGLLFLPRESVSVQPVGDLLWEGIVRYGTIPQTNESAFSFDTGGGAQHITPGVAWASSPANRKCCPPARQLDHEQSAIVLLADAIKCRLGVHLMNVWVVKSTLKLRDGSKGWHWDNYLPVDDDCAYDPDEVAADWGGADWVRSFLSKKLLREEVHEGDIVVCYQSDGREILGLTTMASDGKEDPPRSGDFNMFDLAPPSDALILDPPLTIASLYAADCRPKCFGPGMQGTVFRVEDDEFVQMLGVLRGEISAEGRRELDAWLRRVGWQRAVRAPRRR